MQPDACGWLTILILGLAALATIDTITIAGNICRVLLWRRRGKVAVEEKEGAE